MVKPKKYKTYRTKIQMNGGTITRGIYETSPARAKEWFERVSGKTGKKPTQFPKQSKIVSMKEWTVKPSKKKSALPSLRELF